ncbi:MAG: hypothetical protein ABSE44_19870 [Candidatus Sulfotelmatobacter sp.]
MVLSVCCSGSLLGQQKPATAATFGAQEFPVTLQQSVTAGKTPAGTKIQAKLEVATLVEGAVIPRDAVFSGEVVESVAKTATEPSRVALRMDSVQWKTGSAPLKVYLTSWYYPTTEAAGQDLQYGPTQPANRTWNGQGQYPDPNSKVYKPFPGSDSDKGASVPVTPSAITSNHRVQMKNVDASTNNDGTLALVSKRGNIKLDKLTIYVLASGDLLPAK